MKLKKVLAAVLAGTMVMASTAMVFASETISGTTWWTDMQTSTDFATLSGEGAWTLTVTCDAVDDTYYGAFSVELYDSNGYYITSGSDCNIWAVDSTNDNATIATPYSVPDSLGYQLTAGHTYQIKITRDSESIAIHYYDEGTKYSNTSVSDFTVTMADDLYLHVMAQVGTYTIVSVVDDASGEYLYGGDDSSNTTTEETSEATSEETSEAAATSEETTTSETTTTTSESTTDTTTQTGDAAPIAAVAVALIGCAAIAFASKKRFA